MTRWMRTGPTCSGTLGSNANPMAISCWMSARLRRASVAASTHLAGGDGGVWGGEHDRGGGFEVSSGGLAAGFVGGEFGVGPRFEFYDLEDCLSVGVADG